MLRRNLEMQGNANVFLKMYFKSVLYQLRFQPEKFNSQPSSTLNMSLLIHCLANGAVQCSSNIRIANTPCLHDCVEGLVIVYMSDLLVFYQGKMYHIKQLNTFLSPLRKRRLYSSSKQYEFMKSEFFSSDWLLEKENWNSMRRKFLVLQKWLTRKNLTDLESFTGLLQFICRFIKEFCETATVLTNHET